MIDLSFSSFNLKGSNHVLIPKMFFEIVHHVGCSLEMMGPRNIQCDFEKLLKNDLDGTIILSILSI